MSKASQTRNNTTSEPAPNISDLEDDLVRHHSKLKFLHDMALSAVMTGGTIKFNIEGVHGLELILADLCSGAANMLETITANNEPERKA